MRADRQEVDIVSRLHLLADWVNSDERAPPELHVCEAAAAEIERLRDQLARISQLTASLASGLPP